MNRIPKDIIDDILSRAQVEEVVGDFVNLRKRGANLLGLCPFHQEKTPSFTVSPSKGIYKCFGCGEAGDSVSFLMQQEHYSYPEAIKFLGAKYGVEVPEEELTDEQLASFNEKESIYVALQHAEKFYQEYLSTSDYGKEIGISYLKEREISVKSQEDFKIGYAPGSWDGFTKDAVKKGFQEKYLVAAGLCIKTEKGNLIDRFRDRLMFPIHSLSGRTIGFGGRTLRTDKKEAKYINSPESEVYHKSEVLYGLFQGKKEVKKTNLIYLVEGYTDVISLHQKEVFNVAASSGTSLTEGHLREVKRYSKRICFLFDGDAAGVKASLRAIDLALAEGLDVQALLLPEGEDPDSFAKARSTAEIQAYLSEKKEDFILFKTKLLLPKDADPLQKVEAISQIVASIARIPDTLKRTVYVQQCAKSLEIDEEVLLTELNKHLVGLLKKQEKDWKNKQLDNEKKEVQKDLAQETSPQAEGQKSPTESKDEMLFLQEQTMVQYILQFGHLMYNDAEMETVAEHFFRFFEEFGAHPEDKLLQIILKEYSQHLEEWGKAEVNQLMHHEDPEVRKASINLLNEKYEASQHWAAKIGLEINRKLNYQHTMKRILDRYKFFLIQELLDSAQKDVKTASEDEDIILALTVYQALLQERKKIAKDIGMVVI